VPSLKKKPTEAKGSQDDLKATFEDLVAVGRRISAEAQAERPSDQPRGKEARLSSLFWHLQPLGEVQIVNPEALFSEGYCTRCHIPRGKRTRWRMKVRYASGFSRRCDAAMAQVPEAPLCPSYDLFSKRFLALLSPDERRLLRWRAVEVVNPTKTTMEMFEIIHSDVHVRPVTLRGGNPDRSQCAECGQATLPFYSLVGELPGWLNPTGELTRAAEPYHYIAARELPTPAPVWFTMGDWWQGVFLLASNDRRNANGPGTVDIKWLPVGAVAPGLIASDETGRCRSAANNPIHATAKGGA
jgi:hypothetical protein